MAYEQILVRITGKDRIGLTAAFMEILARHDAQILDIGQADIHSTLSLGILIRIDESHSGQVMKELLFKTTELGVQIGFEPVPDDEYEEWASRQGRTRYILTVIGRSLSAAQIEAAAKIVAEQGLDIDSIKRLTGRLSIAHPERNTRACIEFSLRGTPKDKKVMQESLMRVIPGPHGTRTALVMSTIMFASLHLAYSPFYMLGAAAMLGVFGIIYLRQRSIWGLALIHFTFGMSAAMLGLI